MTHAVLKFAGFSMVAVALAGCQSKTGPTHVPASYLEGTTLTRNVATAQAKTEVLEVNLNPLDSQLRLGEIARVKSFLAQYNSVGHGPLIMSIPKGGETGALAVRAAAELRDIAWQTGIEYEQIAGSAYNGEGRRAAPIILAYQGYVAIKPDCPQLSTIDFADAVSNSDLPTLGCAVRTNMAAIIADPADLFAERPLEPGDPIRRKTHLDTWREGGTTGAARSDDESGAISAAVN